MFKKIWNQKGWGVFFIIFPDFFAKTYLIFPQILEKKQWVYRVELLDKKGWNFHFIFSLLYGDKNHSFHYVFIWKKCYSFQNK